MLQQLIDLDRYELLTVAVDFVIFAALMALSGRMIGGMAGRGTIHELTERDNAAFGISFSAAMMSVAIMMSGAVSGEPSLTLFHEAGIVLAYGILGIVLLILTRLIFDRYALPAIDVRAEVIAGNRAAGLVDAANMISTAIVIRAVMVWVDSESFSGLMIVLLGFLFSQFIMFVVTFYRQAVYRLRNHDASLQSLLIDGNLALALRYSGHRIGAGLAITAASGLVGYDALSPELSALYWAVASLGVVVFLSLIAILARYLILPGVDIALEVGRQRNVAVGLCECVIYIVMGLILAALFALSAG